MVMEEQCAVFCLLSCTFCDLVEMRRRFCVCACNENQLDALFILSLFRHSTATCFGHICSPSPGGILYVCVCVCVYIYTHTHTHTQQLVRVVLLSWLSVGRASSWFSLHRCIEMHGQQNIHLFVDGKWIYFILCDVTCQTTVFLVDNHDGLIFHKQRVSHEVRTRCLYIMYVDLKH